MARIVKIKNNTGSDGTWAGQTISAGAYFEIPQSKLVLWSNDSQVFDDVGNGNLVVNKGAEPGDDISDPVQGWNWLTGDVNPPRTADGDWHFVNENFAHVTGNNVINWTVEKFLNANTSYSEKFVIPNNKTFTLNFIEGGSSNVPVTVKIEFFDNINGSTCRINPEIRIDEIFCLTVNGAHTTGNTVINVLNTDVNILEEVETNLAYGFKDGSNNTFYRKITAIDTVNDTITLDSGLPNDIADGTLIGLVDRAIGQKGTLQTSTTISWASPPRFFGDGTRYLTATIENDDGTEGGLITGMINGWLTDSSTGD